MSETEQIDSKKVPLTIREEKSLKDHKCRDDIKFCHCRYSDVVLNIPSNRCHSRHCWRKHSQKWNSRLLLFFCGENKSKGFEPENFSRLHSQTHSDAKWWHEMVHLPFNFLNHARITIAATSKQCHIPEATLCHFLLYRLAKKSELVIPGNKVLDIVLIKLQLTNTSVEGLINVVYEKSEVSSIELIGYRMPQREPNGRTVLFTRHQCTKVCQPFFSITRLGVAKICETFCVNGRHGKKIFQISKVPDTLLLVTIPRMIQ